MDTVRWKTGWILILLGVLLLTTATLLRLVDKPNMSSEKGLTSSPSNAVYTTNIQDNISDKLNNLISPNTSYMTKTIQDFPSPVKATIKRQAGNTFSEALNCYLFHAGTDFALREGTVIRILHEGTVMYAGEDPLLGQKVEIDGGDGWSIIYGGLENLRVKQGDFVNKLDAIGQIGIHPGAESQDEEPQLHFEVWHDDLVQVPMT